MAQGESSIRVYMSPDTKHRFKTTCFLKGLNMSDIAAELIENWLVDNDISVTQTKKSPPFENKKVREDK
ncbi:MAG: hypothetical protein KME22_30755 [Hassallia sp. WJT32-NPBG1]|nr:hypothetical protein [Hassallia sp. WJT32-NPBG1]